jgi:chromobox protein 1
MCSGSASIVLEKYYDDVGGRDHLLSGAKKPAKKRSRVSETETGNGLPDRRNGKKVRRDDVESMTPPVSAKKVEFKPPSGSWEDEVQTIDACEGTNGEVVVFLQWATGHRTQHPLAAVYKRCPQKVCVLPVPYKLVLMYSDAQIL